MFNSNRKATVAQLEKYVADIKSRRVESPVVEPTVPPVPAVRRTVWGLCTPIGDWTDRFVA